MLPASQRSPTKHSGRQRDSEGRESRGAETGDRKTGYKIFDRYKEHGLSALSDRSRRPVRYANQLPQQVESLIVRLKAEKPHWGARKLRELLVRRLDGDVRVPAKSTIHAADFLSTEGCRCAGLARGRAICSA